MGVAAPGDPPRLGGRRVRAVRRRLRPGGGRAGPAGSTAGAGGAVPMLGVAAAGGPPTARRSTGWARSGSSPWSGSASTARAGRSGSRWLASPPRCWARRSSSASGLTSGDWRRAALTVVVGVFLGPTVNSLVQRGSGGGARVGAGTGRVAPGRRAARGDRAPDRGLRPDGLIVEFNPGAEKMLGWTRRGGRRHPHPARCSTTRPRPRPGRPNWASSRASTSTPAPARRCARRSRLDLHHQDRGADPRVTHGERDPRGRRSSPGSWASGPTSPPPAPRPGRWRHNARSTGCSSSTCP